MILLSCPIPLGQRACGALNIRRVWVFVLLKTEQTMQLFLHAMTPHTWTSGESFKKMSPLTSSLRSES